MKNRTPTNPNSRIGQENMGSTVRRSFASNGSKLNKSRIFNPITTAANTPAEYARRSSFGRNDGCDYEQKENEQDINPQPARLRSPSVVKGSKNFMSPTISAASKINASPRKKVLGERSEAIHTSASYSAGKFHFYSTALSENETYALHDHENVLKLKPEICPQTNNTLLASMTATEFSKEGTENSVKESVINITAIDDDKNELEPDVVVLSPLKSFKCDEPEFPIKEMSAYSVDLIPPPYDPKNNYLSPRPQFLHYNPKPRVAYVNQGILFEDEFVPENSSETERSNEETTLSKDSGEVTPQSSLFSEPSQSSRISGSCESSQISESCDSQMVKENDESETATKRKSGYFTFSRFLVFILVVSLAFLHAIHAPSITATWNQDRVMSKFLDESHKVANLAREHMESWCDSLKLQMVQSFGHLSSITGGKVKKLGPLKYINVTDLPDYNGRDYEFEKFKMDAFGVEKGSTELVGDKIEIQGYDDWNYEFEQVTMDTSSEQNINIDLIGDKILGNKEDYMCIDYPKVENDSEFEDHVGVLDKSQVRQPDYLEVNELQENSEISAPEDRVVENVFDNSEAVATEQQQYLIETDHEESRETAQENAATFVGVVDETQIMIEEVEHISTEPELKRSTPLAFEEWKAKLLEVVDSVKQLLADNMVGTSIISVAALLLATALICLKLKNHFPQQQVEELKPLSKSTAACNIKPQILCSESGLAPEEFEEMEGESCSSEAISSQRVEKSICSKRGNRAADEVHSHERNRVRRNHKSESLTPTSSEYTMVSPSYGSFTAYSIVRSKNGDEEAVTPLRRSNRIRNKVTYSSLA